MHEASKAPNIKVMATHNSAHAKVKVIYVFKAIAT